VRREKRARLIRFVVATVFVVLISIPLYFAIIAGMMELSEIARRPPYLFPPNPTLTYYRQIAPLMTRPLLNSFLIGICIACITVCLAPLVGYGLAKLRLREEVKGAVLGLIFLLQLLPGVSMVTPLFLVFYKLGLINNLWSVIVAIAAGQVPFVSLILATYMASGIPNELIESAYIDGASSLRAFRSIVLPLARPALATAWLLSFMAGWGDLLLSMCFVQNKSLYPASVAMMAYTTSYGTQWNLLMAAATLYALPPVFVALVAGRQLASGLLSGAIK